MKMSPTNEQIKLVIETYHRFPINGITIEILKMAHNVSGLDYEDCKKIIETHLVSLYQK